MDERLAQDVAALVALFKQGGWRELRVESNTLSLLLSISPDAAVLGGAASAPAPAALTPAPAAPVSQASRAAKRAPASIDPSWRAVTAPNLGTFYRSPKPGAAPFVEVGDRVIADTEICLLEVMKLFTSVKAGVSGTVAAVVAVDAELVEGGQILFHIKPD